jgi:hypothetical protein
MAKLQLEPNVPVEVALSFPTGRTVSSQFPPGTQVMYTLTSGELLFVPPAVAEKITALGVARGEAFTICRAGNNHWKVGRGAGALRADPAQRDGIDFDDVPPQRTLPPERRMPAPRPPQHREPPPLLSESLKAALHAAMQAEIAAKEAGYELRFTSADVTALGIAVLTNVMRCKL